MNEGKPEDISGGWTLSDIARPRLGRPRQALDAEGWRDWLGLLGLTIIGVFVVFPMIGGLAQAAHGGPLPTNVNQELAERSFGWLVLWGVILAPLWEEGIYRSWLGGARSSLLGLPMLMMLTLGFALRGAGVAPGTLWVLTLGCLAGMALFYRYLAGLPEPVVARRAARLFPLIAIMATALFALLHTSNYEGGMSSPGILVAVIPQFLIGMVLVHVRLRFGFPAVVLFHGAYNGFMISLFMIADSFSPAGEGAPETAAIVNSVIWVNPATWLNPAIWAQPPLVFAGLPF